MSPEAHAQRAGPIETGPDNSVGDQGRVKPGIKQRKPRRQNASISLNTANQHSIRSQVFQPLDNLLRWSVTMFDEDMVRHNQRNIFDRRHPTKLPFKRCARFVMHLDAGDGWKSRCELLCPFDQPFGR